MMDNSYKQFVDKLDSYIRKFYFYQLVRGLILFILLILVYFSCIAGLEDFSYFDTEIKLAIVLLTLVLTLFIVVYFVLVPLIKLSGRGKRLSYYDVSTLLSTTYPEIKDKLINIVELANENRAGYSAELTRASIEQKIEELKLFSFSDAIRFKDLKVIAFMFFCVLLVFSAGMLKYPDFFSESSVRLIHFQQKYEKPAPYVFVLENKDMEIITGESIELSLR